MDDAALAEALTAHPAIEASGDAYTVSTAALDNELTIAYGELVVTVTMPSLRAIVADDDPADVVVEGWFDGLEPHLHDADSVLAGSLAAEPAIAHGPQTVEATYRLAGTDATALVADAKAIVDFVVGTYLQSAIPGYEYDDPMRGLLGAARSRGRSDSPS